MIDWEFIINIALAIGLYDIAHDLGKIIHSKLGGKKYDR